MADEKLTHGEKEKIIRSASGKNASEKNAPEEYEVALADAARRAYDQELEALANLALIRSGFGMRNQLRHDEDLVPPKGLEERLQDIMKGIDGLDTGRKGGKP